MMGQTFPDSVDLVVVGGGINGVGIAADAAGRGLSVVLAEASDLGAATSSASSKLVHGGLRYLEHWAFRLVREALAEREVLMAKAPHIIWPMRFVLPHVDGMRSKPILRAGLFIYDHLATRQNLPSSRSVTLATDPVGKVLQSRLTSGFAYWDCWVDDARLVVLNAMAARAAGATILPRSPVTAIRPDSDRWLVTVEPKIGEPKQISARAIVNAAGPWVSQVAALTLGGRNTPPPQVRLIKGSHIVIPRIRGADDALILQHGDGRIVFVLPFEHEFTLIGTTDVAHHGDPRDVAVSAAEVDYLLDAVNAFLNQPIGRSDIVWQFAGVRPLDDDGSDQASAVSRDYRLDLDASGGTSGGGAPVLHVIGGKITTYRKLAEHAVDLLQPTFPALGPSQTRLAILPGGDFGGGGNPAVAFETWFADFCRRHSGFEPAALFRLARRYGTRAEIIIGDAASPADLGRDFGAGLTAREVGYLARHEWATTADDVLWRRTKTGLHLKPDARCAAAMAIDGVLTAVR